MIVRTFLQEHPDHFEMSVFDGLDERSHPILIWCKQVDVPQKLAIIHSIAARAHRSYLRTFDLDVCDGRLDQKFIDFLEVTLGTSLPEIRDHDTC